MNTTNGEDRRSSSGDRQPAELGQSDTACLARAHSALVESCRQLFRARTPDEIFELFLLSAVAVLAGAGGALLRRVEGTEHEFVALAQESSIVPRALWRDEPLAREVRKVTRIDRAGVIANLVDGREQWVLVDDALTRWAPGPAAYHRQEGHRSFVASPFFVDDRMEGYLAVAFRHAIYPSQVQWETLQALSNQAVAALELHTLTKQVEEAASARLREEQARIRAAELAKANAALRNSSQRLLTLDHLEHFLRQIVESAAEVAGAACGGVGLLNESGSSLRIVALCDDSGPNGSIVQQSVAGLEFPVEGAVQKVWDAIAKDPGYWWSTPDDPGFTEWFRDYHLARMHQQIAHVPVMRGDQVIGFLALGFRTDFRSSESRLEMLQVLAQHAALALQMAKLSKDAEMHAAKRAALEERNHIAREIHDTLAQGFTGVLMQLRAMECDGSDRAAIHLNNAKSIAKSSLDEARRSVRELRHADSGTGSLTEALKVAAHLTEIQYGIPVSVDCANSAIFGSDESQELLRIAQEAMTNAVKHARPQRIDIRCYTEDGERILQITDDGSGFNPSGKTEGFGLIGMRERAERIGGRLAVESGPKGTSVRISLPVREANT